MNKKTLIALQEAIIHWENNNKDLAQAYTGGDACALCEIFVEEATFESQCVGCPVFQHAKQKFCRGTPWKEAASAIYDYQTAVKDSNIYTDNERKSFARKAHKACQDEIDFLKSLLPKESEITGTK